MKNPRKAEITSLIELTVASNTDKIVKRTNIFIHNLIRKLDQFEALDNENVLKKNPIILCKLLSVSEVSISSAFRIMGKNANLSWHV